MGIIEVNIIETDPKREGNYIRNISIVRQEYEELYSIGAVFNPKWIEKIKDFRSLRFMEWAEINDSKQMHWNDRNKVNSAFWGDGSGGVPLEILVKLANQVGADPWFNIPHLATDDYIRNYAVYVRDNLDPKLKAYVEYSNEVWNWTFSQAEWAQSQGRKRWPGTEGDWVQYYAIKSLRMSEIWTEAFGDEYKNRLVRVLSTQTGWEGLEQYILHASAWLKENPEKNIEPYKMFDAYGGHIIFQWYHKL